MSDPDERRHPFARCEAHPFEASQDGAACAFCGEHRDHILHHPARIRAACLLRGLDPKALLSARRRRDSHPA
jgi:hypothetical protein